MIHIPITQIYPHPNNPRKDLGNLDELAESMKTAGILQNLTVVKNQKKEDLYTVVIGHRRLAAAKMAGLTEVPCTVAEMDEKTQIATMLLENIQRTDLTIYEQAKGFQMMMDLGETPEEIQTLTGFSKTTIRRRINLLELDPVEFKKAVSRGATLMDFIELEKVKDADRKNKVLESIGTQNFKWNLTQAIDKEKSEDKVLAQLSIVEQYATRMEEPPYRENMKFVKRIYIWSEEKELTIPEDASSVQYFYVYKKDQAGIAIWKQITPEETKEDEQDATEQREKRERFEKRRAELQEISTRAYKLRMEFAKSLRIPKKSIGIVLEEMAKCIWNGAYEYGIDTDDLCTFLDIEDPESEEESNRVKELIKTVPERLLFLGVYSTREGAGYRYYELSYSNGTVSHTNSEQLNDTYEFLERFGYQLSDEERAMRDGTHELFIEEGVSE